MWGEYKNATRRIRVKRGCPQGDIRSPFLWNLVIDDLLNYSVNIIPGFLQAFADDIITLAEGDDTDIWQPSKQVRTGAKVLSRQKLKCSQCPENNNMDNPP